MAARFGELIYIFSVEKKSFITAVIIISHKFLLKPSIETFLFLSLTFSLSITRYYRHLRLSLNNESNNEMLAKIRQLFVKTRKIVAKFDHSMILVRDQSFKTDLNIHIKLTWYFLNQCQTVTITHAILTIMLQIYMISNHKTIPLISMKSYYISNSVSSTIYLIIICVINDLLYNEADSLLLALEERYKSNSNSNENTFRELMTLRTINWKTPNGFTIGGLMPLKRTTLLSVIHMIFDQILELKK